MSSTFTKVAAVAASTTMIVAGAQAAQAQSSIGSSTRAERVGENTAAPASGSLAAYGLSPDSGSLFQGANATGNGSVDTEFSSLGEPTFGSLAGVVSQVTGSVNFSDPAPGTGSLDTTASIIKEPTSGSLAPIVSQVAGVLGTGEGITSILDTGSAGSMGGGSTGALVPLVLVGGSVAAGIAAAPMIQQALAGAKIALPPLPAGSSIPGMPAPMPAPAKPAAPGPIVNNGRG